MKFCLNQFIRRFYCLTDNFDLIFNIRNTGTVKNDCTNCVCIIKWTVTIPVENNVITVI